MGHERFELDAGLYTPAERRRIYLRTVLCEAHDREQRLAASVAVRNATRAARRTYFLRRYGLVPEGHDLSRLEPETP